MQDGEIFTDRFWVPDNKQWLFVIEWNNFSLATDDQWKKENEKFFAYLGENGSWVKSIRTLVSDEFEGMVRLYEFNSHAVAMSPKGHCSFMNFLDPFP